MLKSASMLASADCCVTILGPTGTGKELVAKILHARRGFKFNTTQDNFRAVNCSGIVPTLFESLLFGHLKGAFSGAHTDRNGILATAGTREVPGTVFMDEVGDLPLDQQAKLLRVIQEGKITRVGDTVEIPIFCRFVFATNRDLKAMVAAGQFREDLYYRITTVILRTKPLTAREGDALLIANAICQRNGWGPRADVPLAAYSKGNVRQLYNWLYCTEHGYHPDIE